MMQNEKMVKLKEEYTAYSPTAIDLFPKRMVPKDAPLRVRRGELDESSPD